MHAHIAYAPVFPEYFLDGIKTEMQEAILKDSGADIPKKLLDKVVNKALSEPDCVTLVRQIEEAGISKTVLLIADMGYGEAGSDLKIDELYRLFHGVLSKHPDKFIVFAGGDPRRGIEGIELFEKGIKEYNFKGLKLYPPCGYELNDPGLIPYYELCRKHNLPVLTHTGPSLNSLKIEEHYPASIMEIAAKFKDVAFILGHGAFQNFETNLNVAVQHDNVYLEVSGFQKLMDDEQGMKKKLEILFNRVPGKVLFGTDYPMFNMNNPQIKWVDYFRNIGVL
ncbi:MAG: amidohydrolase family protein, partial [bacterium]|nr:amidohydrolase family protein [bacterium]